MSYQGEAPMKYVRRIEFKGFCAALSLLAAGQATAADVTVNLNTTYQTIDGFGGMQDKSWTGYTMSASDLNLLYGTGPGQIGLTIMRLRIYETGSSAWAGALKAAGLVEA